jgi:cyclic pyranopterin phosphate synthase
MTGFSGPDYSVMLTKRNSHFECLLSAREKPGNAVHSSQLAQCLVIGPSEFEFPGEFPMEDLTHVDELGRLRMVDTGAKEITARRAVASARVLMKGETVAALKEHRTPKGDPLEAARLAGIMAAKKTADLIPLCHPLPLTHIEVRGNLEQDGVYLEAEVSTNAQTGVEMEALTAVAIAALTVYDMCKALDKEIRINEVRLESKTGGKSGDYHREASDF